MQHSGRIGASNTEEIYRVNDKLERKILRITKVAYILKDLPA